MNDTQLEKLVRRGLAPIGRGTLIATVGMDRLEAVLYERDELRDTFARAGACGPCREGAHDCCARTSTEAYLETYPGMTDQVPSCSCPDCALGIPEAATDTSVPREVQAAVESRS